MYIIICDIYIAPYSAKSCSKALYNIIYNIIILDSDLFTPSTHLNSQGSIQRMLPSFLWMSEPVATWHLTEPRTRDRSATV